MVAKSKGDVRNGTAGGGGKVPTAAEVASGGIGDSRDLCRLGGALINDMLGDRVSGKLANPICRTGNMMLRAADLEHRHNDGKPLPMA